MALLGIAGGLLSGIGSLFGNKSKSQESFEKWTDSKTDASSQDLSPQLLKALEELFMSSIGSGGFGASTDALQTRLAQVLDQTDRPAFDPEAFQRDITAQATAGAQLDLESAINGLLSQAGGSESGNSMAMLLGNKIRNQTAANLAGVSADARARGEEILAKQQGALTESVLGLGTGLSQQILGLIQSTRGASQKGTSHTKEHTKGTGTSSGTSGGGPGGFFSALGGALGNIGGARANA